MMWMIGLSVVSCFIVLFLFGRRNERAIRRDWELLLTPKGESLYRSIEGRVQNELALVDFLGLISTKKDDPNAGSSDLSYQSYRSYQSYG